MYLKLLKCWAWILHWINCSYGEEKGWRCKQNSADYVWVLDPIDGTKSFITGISLTSLILDHSVLKFTFFWLFLFCIHLRETLIWYSHCSFAKWHTSKSLSHLLPLQCLCRIWHCHFYFILKLLNLSYWRVKKNRIVNHLDFFNILNKSQAFQSNMLTK